MVMPHDTLISVSNVILLFFPTSNFIMNFEYKKSSEKKKSITKKKKENTNSMM